jgi:Rrf2 family protein
MPVVSRRTRYALHGLAYMAASAGDQPVSFEEILAYLQAESEPLSLSPSYIAKIFQRISQTGLTHAVPGPRGGYRLSRPPEEIRLIQILEVLEGPPLTDCCLLDPDGERSHQEVCGLLDLVHEAEIAFCRVFEQETLASLAAKMGFPDAAAGAAGGAAGSEPEKD